MLKPENALTQVSTLKPAPGELVFISTTEDIGLEAAEYVLGRVQEWYPKTHFIFAQSPIDLFDLPDEIMHRLGWVRKDAPRG